MKTFSKVGEGFQAVVSTTERVECMVYAFQMKPIEAKPVKKGRRFSDFAQQFSLGDDHDQLMADARRWVGEQLENAEEEQTLSSLRLKRGLNQSQLGELVEMQQPNVARFEKGIGSPGLDTIRRWCEALDIDMNTFDAAHKASLKHSRKK